MRYVWIVMLLGSTSAAYAAPSHAKHAKHVIMHGDVGIAEIAMHPDFVTVLAFPETVQATIRMDQSVFVEHSGRFVRIRPDKLSKSKSNLIVLGEQASVNVILRMAESAESATAQVDFKRAGNTFAAGGPISLDIDGVVGLARSGDSATGAMLDTAVVAGASARLALRGSRFHAYEATVTLAQTGAMSFPDIEHDGLSGPMKRYTLLSRILIGGHVHMNGRIKPLMRAGVGLQGRALLSSQIAVHDGGRVAGPENDYVWDVVASAGGGVELRITKKWSIGVCVTATRSVMKDSPLFETMEAATYVHWN